MIIKASIFLVVCFFSTALSIKPNFYWRDYDGTIPDDAIRGGKLNGKTTYIGLVATVEGPVSALIIPGDPKAYTTMDGKAVISLKGAKILCTTVPCRFVWTKKLEDNCVYVTGSYIDSAAVYIGRATYEGNVVTGRTNFNLGSLYFPSQSPDWTYKRLPIEECESLAYCE
ncbi:hypothetical protein RI129_013182 [Pyrocoelia pectoralis]|uniref:Uncharacterized protein n=1 Tax=Pyrocoelia pectoralis TaxID=417401 RepID=A0AAN7ZD17_9COLE